MGQVFNTDDRQLTEGEIHAGLHRDIVGGMWEEMGRLQFDFPGSEYLLPLCNLLAVGCGAARGGLRPVEYPAAVRYFELDISESLIEAGRRELEEAGLTRDPRCWRPSAPEYVPINTIPRRVASL